MRKTTDTRKIVRWVVLGLGASLLALVGASVGPASADGDLTVTWPGVAALNPDNTPYEVLIEHSGTQALFLVGADSSPQLTVVGPNPVQFGADGTRRLDLFECPTPTFVTGDCVLVRTGPTVRTYRTLHVSSDAGQLGPSGRLSVGVTPSAATTADVSWEVVPASTPSGAALTSGAEEGVVLSQGLPPLGPVPDMVDGGQYLYRATLTAETPEYGMLQGTLERSFVWRPTVKASVDVSNLEVYPAKDDYRDELTLTVNRDVQAGEILKSVRFVITDPGDTVLFDRTRLTSSGDRYVWRPRDADGVPFPEGSYAIGVVVTDADHNVRTWDFAATVSHERRTVVRWKKTVPAARAVLDKVVGRCADLARPARPSWEGSLGYHSERSCSSPRETVVATASGLYIPHSPFGDYTRIKIGLYGGRAKGSTSQTLGMQYLRNDDRWVGSGDLSGRLGMHWGSVVWGRRFVHDWAEGKPYVVWSNGIGGGGRYDAKTVTVEVNYVVLK